MKQTENLKNNLLRRLAATAFTAMSMLCTNAQENTGNLVLRYDSPAEHFEEALVIGNGTMGATVYGGTRIEKISLNDITLWTGEPDKEVTTPGAYKALPEIRAARKGRL